VSIFRFPHWVSSTRLMMFDLSWALMRLRLHRKLGWLFFEAVDLQGKIGNQLFQIVVLPLEVFDLLTGGVSLRVPGEPRFPRFHGFLGPGIEYAWLDPLLTELFQIDADLVFRGVLPAGPGPYLPDESPGLLS